MCHLLANTLVGDSLGLVAALGNNRGGEEEGDEDAGELHFDGFEVEEEELQRFFVEERRSKGKNGPAEESRMEC